MATLKCKSCSRETNTVFSKHQYILGSKNFATECYGAFEGNKLVKGCAYSKAPSFTKSYVDRLIKIQPWSKKNNVI